MPLPQAFPQDPSPAESAHLLALTALEEDRIEDAVAQLRLSLSSDPRRAEAWNDLGVVMESLDNPHEAVRCYRQSLCLRPGLGDARDNLIRLLFQFDAVSAPRRYPSRSNAA